MKAEGQVGSWLEGKEGCEKHLFLQMHIKWKCNCLQQIWQYSMPTESTRSGHLGIFLIFVFAILRKVSVTI